MAISCFKCVVRFNCSDDLIKRFDSLSSAQEYFDYLMRFEFDGLFNDVWCISLLKNSKVLRHYTNYLNVKL